MKKAPIILLVLVYSFLVTNIVWAQNTSWLSNVANGIVSVAGSALVALMGVALVVLLWGGVVFVQASGDEKGRAAGRSRMIWGIVGLFVLSTLWGIVQILQNITDTASPPPQTQPGVIVG